MSLTVDTSKVSPPPSEDEQSGIFSVGIALAVLGVSKLETMKDLSEVLFRSRFYSKLFGPLLETRDGTDLANTKAYWDRWSQVRINGTPEKRSAWVRRMTKQATDELESELRKEL